MQLLRYVEAILGGAAEDGVRQIQFIPEKDDIAVYFTERDRVRRRVMSIPIPSFAELWREALAPGFQTGQHVMTIGSSRFLFRLKEGRMALGEDVTIEISELKPEDLHPLSEQGDAVFHEGPWEQVRKVLDSIINLALERECERIEMHPGDPEVTITYFIRGQGRNRFTISKQTYRQMVHYMKEFYFFFGFVEKHFAKRDFIIKPRLIDPVDEPTVIIDIERLDTGTGEADGLFSDFPGFS
jgi:hypothetical protein